MLNNEQQGTAFLSKAVELVREFSFFNVVFKFSLYLLCEDTLCLCCPTVTCVMEKLLLMFGRRLIVFTFFSSPF